MCVCEHGFQLQVTKLSFLVLGNRIKSLVMEETPPVAEIREDGMTVYVHQVLSKSGRNHAMCKQRSPSTETLEV